MQSIVFVNTTSSKCRARITGIDLPRVHAKLESDLQITVKFFSDGNVPALLSSPTFRVGFKATPTGAVLELVTVVAEELADGYVFDFARVTSPALLAAIGDTKLFECTFEVEWTIDGEVARAACPATIENAFIRAADSAPNPADPLYEVWLRERTVRYDEEQDLTNEQKAQARANIGVGEGGEGGVTDHGALTGLSDDDHPQYHNNARGDARYAGISHTHAQSEVTGLVDALAGKAATSHTHAQSEVTGLEAALAGKAASSHTHAQSEVTGLEAALAGKAATSHTHAQSEVTGLEAALAGKAATSHTHAQSEVTGLEAALAGKAATSHTHAQSEVTGLEAALAGKAASSHTHAQSEVTGLEAALVGKAATSHTHAQSEVTGLEAALAGKAASSHTHAQSEVTGLVDALAGKAASSHTHSIANVTGLQSALDGKADSGHTHEIPFAIQIACSDPTTALTTGAAKVTFRMPHAANITEIRASVSTAPSGSSLVVDINASGASIFDSSPTQKLNIDADTTTSLASIETQSLVRTSLDDDEEIQLDIDQVGSSTAGIGLVVTIIGTRA